MKETTKFEIGREYKLLKRNGDIAIRTFTVEKISRKNKAILVKGGINGIYDLKIKDTEEWICLGLNQRCYLNPCSKDTINK